MGKKSLADRLSSMLTNKGIQRTLTDPEGATDHPKTSQKESQTLKESRKNPYNPPL